MKRHTKSFFGQKTGIILDSADWDNPNIYLTFLKKNENGSWEKPSESQGKKIKLNLGEVIMIQKVLAGSWDKWSTVHKFKKEQTSISISKDQNNENQIWFNVGKYNKNLRSPELDLFQMIIQHILKEKIEYATGFQRQNFKNKTNIDDLRSLKEKNLISDQKNPKEIVVVNGEYKNQTEKAILIYFEQNKKEIWVPKSTIKSEIKENSDKQNISILRWIVEKNGLKIA